MSGPSHGAFTLNSSLLGRVKVKILWFLLVLLFRVSVRAAEPGPGDAEQELYRGKNLTARLKLLFRLTREFTVRLTALHSLLPLSCCFWCCL